MTEYKNSVQEIFNAATKLIDCGSMYKERVDIMNAAKELLDSLTLLRELYEEELFDGDELARLKADTNENYIRLEYCVAVWDSEYRSIYIARTKANTLVSKLRTALLTDGFCEQYGRDKSVDLSNRLTKERLFSKQATYEPDYQIIKESEEVLNLYEREKE